MNLKKVDKRFVLYKDGFEYYFDVYNFNDCRYFSNLCYKNFGNEFSRWFNTSGKWKYDIQTQKNRYRFYLQNKRLYTILMLTYDQRELEYG